MLNSLITQLRNLQVTLINQYVATLNKTQLSLSVQIRAKLRSKNCNWMIRRLPRLQPQ